MDSRAQHSPALDASESTEALSAQEVRREIRRQFLAMVARRQRPGSGSNLTALDVRRIMMDWWTDANRALQGVRHAVAGAVAVNAYAPERLTRDIDMVVVAADSRRAAAALERAGWTRTAALGGGVQGHSWQDAAGHTLDLIALRESWAAPALDDAQTNVIAGLPTLTLPYLVYMKLRASRTIDLGDVSRMLGRATPEQVQLVREVVGRYGDREDLADLNQLLRMGRLERGLGEVSTDVDR